MEVFVLSIGVININTGKTQYDWSIYDDKPEITNLYHCKEGFLIRGAKGSLEIGDSVIMRNNDTRRKLGCATIDKVLPVTREELIDGLYELGYDYKPKRAFKKSAFKKKLRTSFTLK